jgi:hypothetical protein
MNLMSEVLDLVLAARLLPSKLIQHLEAVVETMEYSRESYAKVAEFCGSIPMRYMI